MLLLMMMVWCGGGDHEQQWQTSKCTMAHKASNTLWLPTFSSIAGIVVAVNYANYAMHELPRFQPSLQQCCSADRRLCPMDELYGSCYRIAQSHLISWLCERLTGTRRSIPSIAKSCYLCCLLIITRNNAQRTRATRGSFEPLRSRRSECLEATFEAYHICGCPRTKSKTNKQKRTQLHSLKYLPSFFLLSLTQ